MKYTVSGCYSGFYVSHVARKCFSSGSWYLDFNLAEKACKVLTDDNGGLIEPRQNDTVEGFGEAPMYGMHLIWMQSSALSLLKH